jgi:pimeloyl-ACP methyl ester carboxylesterase
MLKVEKKLGYFKSFDGHQIYFESRGKGEPVVFVYGIACLINHWHHQIEYFSKHNQTLIVDLRGHHKTAKPDQLDHLSLACLGRDLKALLDHFNLKRAHFVGHSFGAQVMLSAYQNHPEIFRSMTFINGFASNPIKEMFGLGVVDKLYRFIKTNYNDNPSLWKTLWRMGIDNPLTVPFTSLVGGFNLKLTSLKDIQVYTKGVANIDLEVFLYLFEELINFEGNQILPEIECPVLVISGEEDRVTPFKFQKEMADKIRHSEFLKVPYGSHCTQLDFPDYVNLRLEKFIKSNK